MNREAIYQSVFQFFAALTVGGSPAFKVATRKLQTWDQAPAEDSPQLAMSQVSETAEKRKGFPTKWVFNIRLFMYVKTQANNDLTVVPSQLINPLIDALELALKPDDISNDACTLGGLVSHCAINGTILIFEGTQGDDAVAILPIQILVPSPT